MREHLLTCESVRVDRSVAFDGWFTIEASFTLHVTKPEVAEIKISEIVEALLSKGGVDITKAEER